MKLITAINKLLTMVGVPDWSMPGDPSVEKLDGIGPVDNRPSTNWLQHFINNNKNLKMLVTFDM